MTVKRKFCWMLILQILTGILIYLGVSVFRPKLQYGILFLHEGSLLEKNSILESQITIPHSQPKIHQNKDEIKISLIDSTLRTPNLASFQKYFKEDLQFPSSLQNLLPKFSISDTISKREYKFENYNVKRPFLFFLPDDEKTYFVPTNHNLSCFENGFDKDKHIDNFSGCLCKDNWRGLDCSIPEVIWLSKLPDGIVLTLRKKPRRIINGFNFNHEFDFLDARLHELYPVVDVFIICESNYSAYGSPKPLRLLDRLKEGYLKQFQDKIVYVFLDHFPEGGDKDGWIADSYLRTFLGQSGLQQIINVHQDDIFVLTDADEIPLKEILLFLKLYDGYPEPIHFQLRWSFYGFFWKKTDKTTTVAAACTTAMLKYVYNNDAIRIRRNDYMRDVNRLSSYVRIGGRIQEWFIGNIHYPAGWHCSWCYIPEGIRLKLISAQNGDFPRWGDFKSKRDLFYIQNLIKNGLWFDDSKLVENMTSMDQDSFFAPKYMIDNFSQFGYLLRNPYT